MHSQFISLFIRVRSKPCIISGVDGQDMGDVDVYWLFFDLGRLRKQWRDTANGASVNNACLFLFFPSEIAILNLTNTSERKLSKWTIWNRNISSQSQVEGIA